MVRGAVLAVVLCVPYMAHATSASEEREKLLGWSADGKTWAVLSTVMMDETIKIKRRGKVVMEVCNRANTEAETPCKRGRKMIAIDREPKGKLSGLERFNIETHKALKKYGLKRVSSSWRADFKKHFKLSNGPKGTSPYGKACTRGWTLTRRSDGKRIKRVRRKTGCAKALGGYMSSNGKYLLIKTHAHYQPDPETGDTQDDVLYLWIKL